MNVAKREKKQYFCNFFLRLLCWKLKRIYRRRCVLSVIPFIYLFSNLKSTHITDVNFWWMNILYRIHLINASWMNLLIHTRQDEQCETVFFLSHFVDENKIKFLSAISILLIALWNFNKKNHVVLDGGYVYKYIYLTWHDNRLSILHFSSFFS